MKYGQKVMIKNTKQLGTFIRDTHNGLRADVSIQTPNGEKVINVVKILLVVIKVIDGVWPILKELWSIIRGNKNKKRIVITDNDLEI